MIAIISSVSRERTAFVTLCENHGWAAVGCNSVGEITRAIHRTPPRVLLLRHRLDDGYSDDVIATFAAAGLLPTTKIIVLLGAGAPAKTEARQLTLGADCVHRDPVRIEVLLAYIEKYIARPRDDRIAPSSTEVALFGGAALNVLKRTLRFRAKVMPLTPREVVLLELLAGSKDKVITYDILYSEILGRRFHGDTSNMRVLLGKLNASTRAIGITLNRWVKVIPKTGYCYKGSPGDPERSR